MGCKPASMAKISVSYTLNDKPATILIPNPPSSVEKLLEHIKEEIPSLRSRKLQLIETKTLNKEIDLKVYHELL
jgi:hypothetical protein